jgi:N-acetylglucosaminyldiphosphoundecaprenol N-acetyl-beta-D-mannosaminyltransferase
MFFLGGLDNEAELTAKKLKANYSSGPKLDNNAEPISEVDRKSQIDVITKINSFGPQLLFVGFGNPKQEIWINKNLSKLNIGGAMALGGTFRYMSGHSPLPPKWMDQMGLEWLWRLFTEPFRFTRIWNAVIIFPLRVLMSKLWQNRA